MKSLVRHAPRLVCAAALTLLLSGATPAAAQTLGGQLYATGGAVSVTIEPASAGYTSELWLFDSGLNRVQFVGTNHANAGQTFNLGSYSAGLELIFGIFVRNTGDTFYMGPASRNADGLHHATTQQLAPGVVRVGFEDLFGGGDRDYDDNVFTFRGGINTEAPAPNAVPEPASMALMLPGLAAAGVLKRRRKRSEADAEA